MLYKYFRAQIVLENYGFITVAHLEGNCSWFRLLKHTAAPTYVEQTYRQQNGQITNFYVKDRLFLYRTFTLIQLSVREIKVRWTYKL